jgi:hypothetical protein
MAVFGLYLLGFGLNQAKRSAFKLNSCLRIGSVIFVDFALFPFQDLNALVMILLAVPVIVIVWFILFRFFASWAKKAAV